MAEIAVGTLMNPEWEKASKVHDWRNYAGTALRAEWNTLSIIQRAAIAETLQDVADKEDWD